MNQMSLTFWQIDQYTSGAGGGGVDGLGWATLAVPFFGHGGTSARSGTRATIVDQIRRTAVKEERSELSS